MLVKSKPLIPLNLSKVKEEDTINAAIFLFSDLYSQHICKASDGGYLCNLCDKHARDFYAMKRHLEGKHDITPGYKCPVCKMFCKTNTILMLHRKNCH